MSLRWKNGPGIVDAFSCLQRSPEELMGVAGDGSGCLGGKMSRDDRKKVDNGRMNSQY